jgi:hypothetical protein
MTQHRSLLAAGVVMLAVGGPTYAGERLFGYSYEPTTMPAGAIELEQSVTSRLGKAGGVFSEFDLRSEIEVGVLDYLQTSLYLNTEMTRAADARSGRHNAGFITNDSGDQRFSDFSFDSISNEWVMKFLDTVADPIGFAVYVELETNGSEFEIEEKLLFGKVVGPFSIAVNLIFEQDFRARENEPNRAIHFDFSAGVAYRVPETPLSIGLELRQENQLDFYTQYTHAVISIGPNIHWATEHWWATITVLPQVASPTPTYKSFDYDGYEVIEVRLIVGIEF